jgi:hypothetical protein
MSTSSSPHWFKVAFLIYTKLLYIYIVLCLEFQLSIALGWDPGSRLWDGDLHAGTVSGSALGVNTWRRVNGAEWGQGLAELWCSHRQRPQPTLLASSTDLSCLEANPHPHSPLLLNQALYVGCQCVLGVTLTALLSPIHGPVPLGVICGVSF